MNPGQPGAQHVHSPLMRESLMDKKLLARTESPVTAILPDINIIQIGGRSIMDRGRSALLPLLDEIVANQSQHRIKWPPLSRPIFAGNKLSIRRVCG